MINQFLIDDVQLSSQFTELGLCILHLHCTSLNAEITTLPKLLVVGILFLPTEDIRTNIIKQKELGFGLVVVVVFAAACWLTPNFCL